MKRFNTLDGKGFERLRGAGISTGIITGEDTAMVAQRAAKIGADYVRQGIQNKLPVVQEICAQHGVQLHEVAYIGDDLNDLEVLSAQSASPPAQALLYALSDAKSTTCAHCLGAQAASASSSTTSSSRVDPARRPWPPPSRLLPTPSTLPSSDHKPWRFTSRSRPALSRASPRFNRASSL